MLETEPTEQPDLDIPTDLQYKTPNINKPDDLFDKTDHKLLVDALATKRKKIEAERAGAAEQLAEADIIESAFDKDSMRQDRERENSLNKKAD